LEFTLVSFHLGNSCNVGGGFSYDILLQSIHEECPMWFQECSKRVFSCCSKPNGFTSCTFTKTKSKVNGP